MGDVNLWLIAVAGVGMVLIAVGASVGWKMISQTEWKWFWIGAGLWTVAVAIKLVVGLLINAAVLGWLKGHLPYAGFIAGSGLFIGVVSSACEIGLTILAVAVWRQLGRDAGRAIAVGVGAGAVEAFLLGAVGIVSVAIAASGFSVGEEIRKALAENQQKLQFVWLIGPLERALALLVHASTRALVLLGFAHRRPGIVCGGFAFFTVVDGIAGAAIVFSKTYSALSPWWIELAIAPLAVASVFILRWCYQRWPCQFANEAAVAAG